MGLRVASRHPAMVKAGMDKQENVQEGQAVADGKQDLWRELVMARDSMVLQHRLTTVAEGRFSAAASRWLIACEAPADHVVDVASLAIVGGRQAGA